MNDDALIPDHPQYSLEPDRAWDTQLKRQDQTQFQIATSRHTAS